MYSSTITVHCVFESSGVEGRPVAAAEAALSRGGTGSFGLQYRVFPQGKGHRQDTPHQQGELHTMSHVYECTCTTCLYSMPLLYEVHSLTCTRLHMCWVCVIRPAQLSCLGGSAGRAVCLERRTSWVQVPPKAALLFLLEIMSCPRASLLAFALSL